MADCQAPIFRNFFDVVIEKGVIDALVAGDNPWSICDQSKSLIQNTIQSARKASNKFISISFHSPIVRLKHLLDEDYNVLGKILHATSPLRNRYVMRMISVKSYQAAMDFYIYDFDFTKRQESNFESLLKRNENDYDGSSISEQSETFMFDIDL